jgi:hypothetical protein
MLVALVSFAAVVRAQPAPAPSPAPAPAPASPSPAPAPGGNGGGNFDKTHPRRAQVNNRLNKNVADGDMTKGQAAKDHKEERAMAKKDGGHITKGDQKKLNNRIDRQKARDKKDGK